MPPATFLISPGKKNPPKIEPQVLSVSGGAESPRVGLGGGSIGRGLGFWDWSLVPVGYEELGLSERCCLWGLCERI